ncbi:RtcB family protein [Candidatus Woesearchaeota archaeon]|nr:RtcB family protein [Candidatus Woesearchaeota archaeon]
MIEVTNLTGSHYHYHPLYSNWEGLKKVILFAEGEQRRRGSCYIPNGTVWVFGKEDHKYRTEILDTDVGCGMAAFALEEVNPKKAANEICEHLRNKNILGRGNHFVDICSPINSSSIGTFNVSECNLLLIHTDGKNIRKKDHRVPRTIEEAVVWEKEASGFRQKMGLELSELMGVKGELMGDWTHNSVEDAGEEIIYRKGVIKVIPEKIHILPASLGEKILLYTVSPQYLPPYSSFPHATGRKSSRGESKVSLDRIPELRQRVYIPPQIADTSLRTEHPDCYHSFKPILEKLGPYIISLGSADILSYVGKV